MSKIALAMIVAPTDREAELLDRLLGGEVKEFAFPAQKEIDLSGVGCLSSNVDSIYITITGENNKCEEVAKKYGAIISKYKWNNNFAEARNFNFSQVPDDYKYIVWFDADDVIRNPYRIRELVKQCDDEAVDSVIMNYLYDFDESGNCNVKHLKTRIVKNDGSFSWVGEVHEDFSANRKIATYLAEDIEALHLTDPKRIESSALRNKEIAEQAIKDKPKDPRVYWNLANTYMLIGKAEEAAKIFLQFLEISNSDEERYMSWLKLAKIYAMIGRLDHAIESCLESLALRPWYPDPYLVMGEINYYLNKHRAAREFLEMGLTKEPPVLETIVYDPLDYTYNPRLLLGRAYFALNQPRKAIEQFEECLKIKPKVKALVDAVELSKRELKKFDAVDDIFKKIEQTKDINEIRKLLNDVPSELKYYPPLINIRNRYFQKTESNGKELAIYCGYTTIEWNPEVAKTKGVGGSEEAVIQLAKRFAKEGYEVSVFANIPGQQERVIDEVIWKPFMAWNYRDKYDIVVIWRDPKFLDYNINSDKVYLDMHDALPPEEFTTSRILKATKILFKSKTQRDYYPQVPDEKAEIIPHGLDLKEFDTQRSEIQRDPYLILNTSSPDRGIKTCIKIIKKVYDKLPDNLKSKLKFSQYYGFDVWDTEFENDHQMQMWKKDCMEQIDELKKLGVMTEDSGKRISQTEITKKYLSAGILLYPSEFMEIGYIGNIKGQIAGCIPLTTDVFAQGEFSGPGSMIVHSDIDYKNWPRDIRKGVDYGVQLDRQIDQFVDKLIEYVKNVEKYDKIRPDLIDYARKNFDWDNTANSWLKLFKDARP